MNKGKGVLDFDASTPFLTYTGEDMSSSFTDYISSSHRSNQMASFSLHHATEGSDPHDSLARNQSSKAKKAEISYYLGRELVYAQIHINRPNMTLEDWQNLLKSNDQDALRVKQKSDVIIRTVNELKSIRRKMKKKPKEESLRQRLQALGKDEKEFERRINVWAKRNPMSKRKRDNLFHLLVKFRGEIDDFNRSGRTKKQHLLPKRMYYRGPAIADPDEKFALGDARADYIEGVIEEMRRMFHKWPLDPLLHAPWLELDKWMRETQTHYRPIVLPTSYPQRRTVSSTGNEDVGVKEQRTRPSSQPITLQAHELQAIHKNFPSKEAFADSLFEDADPTSEKPPKQTK